MIRAYRPIGAGNSKESGIKVGTIKEIKTHEYRVGLVPTSVREFTHHGHSVIVGTGCAAGIGFDDDAYRQAVADIMATASEIFEAAEMIVKVKENPARRMRDAATGTNSIHISPFGRR